MRSPWLALGLCACATVHVAPALGEREQRVVEAVAAARTAAVPEPPLLSHMPMGWPVLCFGTVVAVGDGAFAAQFADERGIPEPPEHYLVPVTDAAQRGIKGDGRVTCRLGDILVCRWFPRPDDSRLRPQLGDHVWIDWPTTHHERGLEGW
jgi:hypothetical protein